MLVATKLDAMGILATEWAPGLFIEAMKFWFYSISFSIFLSLVMLYDSSSSEKVGKRIKTRESSDGDEVRAVAKQRSALRRDLGRKLVIDCCDIFIPGSTTGWLAVSSGTVGFLGMTSSVLASLDIWARVQKSP